MVIGAVYAAVPPTLHPIAFPKMEMSWLAQGNRIIDYYSLVKGSNVSQNVSYVDLNVTVKFGTISLAFSNDPDFAVDAKFDHAENASHLETTQTTNGQVLRVSMSGESGMLNLTLGTASSTTEA